jgi:hypothetical protein
MIQFPFKELQEGDRVEIVFDNTLLVVTGVVLSIYIPYNSCSFFNPTRNEYLFVNMIVIKTLSAEEMVFLETRCMTREDCTKVDNISVTDLTMEIPSCFIFPDSLDSKNHTHVRAKKISKII